MTWYSTTLHACDITQHDTVKYCLIDMTWHFTILSQVPVTGVFGKRTNNVGLCNQPREKVLYFFHSRFIWQTFVQGAHFPKVCLVIVITFPWLTYLATWHSKWYCLSTHKSFLCLSSINKPWENDKKSDMINKQTMVLPLTVSVKGTSVQCLYKCTIPMMWQASTSDKCQSHIPVMETYF
jgi:hypothetical protein